MIKKSSNKFYAILAYFTLIALISLILYFVTDTVKEMEKILSLCKFEEVVDIEPVDVDVIQLASKRVDDIQVDTYYVNDVDNLIYPFNTMDAGWENDLYEEGFKYYRIPQKYTDEGGCLPEVVQAYLWRTCRDYGVDYYMALALIERESGYRYYTIGDNGNSKGYMQIQERYHVGDSDKNYIDLLDPYDNILVGVSTLAEIQSRYLDSYGEHRVLMVYNMGDTTTKKLWESGKYSSKYSRGILDRANQIKQELQDQ